VVGEELHLRRAELEVGRVAVEIEDAGVGVEVVDVLLAGDRVELLLAVAAEPQLHERVAACPLGGALAEEAETPADELRIGAQPHLDRRLLP
jgi:hypothetical protein